jgi:hypothetical protein
VHWLLLIPFYVFTAIGVFLVLSLLCRALRLKLAAHTLAVTAVSAGIAVVLLPLFGHLIDLPGFTGRRLLMLAGVTFVLAAIDALLEPLLPLPFDDELADV